MPPSKASHDSWRRKCEARPTSGPIGNPHPHPSPGLRDLPSRTSFRTLQPRSRSQAASRRANSRTGSFATTTGRVPFPAPLPHLIASTQRTPSHQPRTHAIATRAFDSPCSATNRSSRRSNATHAPHNPAHVLGVELTRNSARRSVCQFGGANARFEVLARPPGARGIPSSARSPVALRQKQKAPA